MRIHKTFYVQAFAFSILISVQQHYVSAFSTVSIIHFLKLIFNNGIYLFFIHFQLTYIIGTHIALIEHPIN